MLLCSQLCEAATFLAGAKFSSSDVNISHLLSLSELLRVFDFLMAEWAFLWWFRVSQLIFCDGLFWFSFLQALGCWISFYGFVLSLYHPPLQMLAFVWFKILLVVWGSSLSSSRGTLSFLSSRRFLWYICVCFCQIEWFGKI